VPEGTVDDFGSCDGNIYDIEGRTGEWYVYRSASVGCTTGSCSGFGIPPWGETCGAWIAGGRGSTGSAYAGIGVGLNADGPTYDACDYTSVTVTYGSDQSVRMYAKWDDTGSTAPRGYVTLSATTGARNATVSLAQFTNIDCATLTEFQFEPTDLSGFGIAIYKVRFQ
jgi:hypothetical protein